MSVLGSMGYKAFWGEDHHSRVLVYAPDEQAAWEVLAQANLGQPEAVGVIRRFGGLREVDESTIPEAVKTGEAMFNGKLLLTYTYSPPQYKRYQAGGDLYKEGQETILDHEDPQAQPDVTAVQARPTGRETEETDVGRRAIGFLNYIGHPEIASDHEKLIDWGEKKYGQRLRTFNGRDCVLDCYQECLDGISYSTQAYMEGRDPYGVAMALFGAAAVVLRGMMDRHQ